MRKNLDASKTICLYKLSPNNKQIISIMQPLKLILVSLTLAVLGVVTSCSNDTNSIDVRNWQILYNQDSSLDSISKNNNWKPIEIPSTIQLPYSSERDFKYVWLKGEFVIKDSPSNYYGISLGRLYHTYKVYINNSHIESQNSDGSLMLHYPVYSIIPGGVLRKGKNEVCIYLGIYGKEYGGITSKVKIQHKNEFIHEQSIDDLIFKLVPFGIAAVFCGILILLIIIYLFFNREIKFLYCSLGIASFILIIISIFFPYKSTSIFYITEIRLLVLPGAILALVPFFNAMLILIIQSLYGIFLSQFNRIIIPILMIIALLNLVFGIVIHNPDINSILTWISIFISIIYYVFLIYRLNSLKKDKFMLYMFIMIVALAEFIMIFEFLSYIMGNCNYGIFAVYSIPVIIIYFLVLYVRDYISKNIRFLRIYDKLKAEANEIKSAKDNKLTITDTAEEKLRVVIDFIKENYTANMSREGLASAVELNPSYFSRLFISYTDMTINEYINKLRIEEAQKKLEDEHARVLDIALSIGFESISTFNRAFRKVTGKTPTEFRKCMNI